MPEYARFWMFNYRNKWDDALLFKAIIKIGLDNHVGVIRCMEYDQILKNCMPITVIYETRSVVSVINSSKYSLFIFSEYYA